MARYALEVGLDDGIEGSLVWGNAITREQAAQMALNTIKAPLVAYKDGTTIIINGEKVSFGSGDAYYVTTTLAKEQRISKQTLSNTKEYTVEFGEKYFPKLILTDGMTDAFGRPAHIWTYKTEDIGTYTDNDLLVVEYTDSVKGKEAYNDIGYSVINQYDLHVYVDGAESKSITKADLTKSNNNTLNNTDKGVLTQVFVDHDTEEITFVIINTYLAEAVSDYNAKTESVRLKVYYGVHDSTPSAAAATPVADTYQVTVDLEDYAIIEGLKSGDNVLITMAAPDHVANATYNKYSIESINEPEVVSETAISSYTTGNRIWDERLHGLATVTAGGTKYSTSAKAIDEVDLLFNYSKEQLADATYNLYMDPYGYVIGVELVSAEDVYMFVVGYDVGSNVLAQATDKALAIFADGTMKTVEIDDSKLQVWNATTSTWVDAPNNRLVAGDDASINAWFTYTVNDAGLYTLRKLVKNQGVETRATNRPIDVKNATLTGEASASNGLGLGYNYPTATAYGNADSTYITVKADKTVDAGGSIVKVKNVTTGIKNVGITPESTASMAGMNYKNVYFMYNNNGYVTSAIVVGDDNNTSSSYIYLTSNIVAKTWDDVNDVYVYTYEAIVDGQATKIQSEVHLAKVATAAGGTLTIPAAATRELRADTLYRGEVNNLGYVSEMVLLPETAVGEMHTEHNADYGYAVKIDDAPTVSAPTAGNDDITLELKGFTLWVIQETRDDNYVILNDNAVFFVKNPANSSDDYEMYTDANGAISATTAENVSYIKSVSVVTDKLTGFAKTVIIDLAYKNEAVTPPAATSFKFNSVSATVSPTTGVISVTATSSDIHDWALGGTPVVDFVVTYNGSEYKVSTSNYTWTPGPVVGTLTVNVPASVLAVSTGSYAVSVSLTFNGTGTDTGSVYNVYGSTSFYKL